MNREEPLWTSKNTNAVQWLKGDHHLLLLHSLMFHMSLSHSCPRSAVAPAAPLSHAFMQSQQYFQKYHTYDSATYNAPRPKKKNSPISADLVQYWVNKAV